MAKQNLDLFGVIMLSTWWMQAQCFHYFSSVFGLHQSEKLWLLFTS